MKVVIAPDSFKGSMTAAQVCAAVSAGVRKASPDAEIISVPMADGGEGTVQSLIDGLGGSFISSEADDPLGRPHDAIYGLTSDGTAVIEMAQASGLTLLEESERDPLLASTYGTGQLIKDALDHGAREFILGIGGSATNDGGAGMAQALGYRLIGNDGADLPRGGGALIHLARIDASFADTRLAESRFTVACDVCNTLTGEQGASAVFGPQKGASSSMIELLDKALMRFAGCVYRDLGKDVSDIPGAGAAGGMGAGCAAFLGARLQRGVDIVIDATGLAEKLDAATLVITGEGRTDRQSLSGKTVYGIAALANKLGVPVMLISGSLAPDAEDLIELGIWNMYSLIDESVSLEEAMREGEALLEKRAESAMLEFLKNEGRV